MSDNRKILIAAGGTGGHIYPAISTAEHLLENGPHEVVFAGGGLEKSPYFEKGNFPYFGVSASPVSITKPFTLIKHATTIAKGIVESIRLLKKFKPDLVLGFGSYHSFPVLAAARLLRYPIMLHEQNSKPGKVIRIFSKSAVLTGAYFPEARRSLPGKSALMAMPLRKGFTKLLSSKEEGQKYFGLAKDKMTLLIFGGSQGAQFINEEIAALIGRLGKKISDFQVLHFTGSSKSLEMVKRLYQQGGVSAFVKEREERMDYAWQASDLAIVRAGAGTIAEQLEFEVPAIFIPYPHAADNHQDSNANFVVDEVCGGWKWQEKGFDANVAEKELEELLVEGGMKLKSSYTNLASYKQKASAVHFTTEILHFLKTVEMNGKG